MLARELGYQQASPARDKLAAWRWGGGLGAYKAGDLPLPTAGMMELLFHPPACKTHNKHLHSVPTVAWADRMIPFYPHLSRSCASHQRTTPHTHTHRHQQWHTRTTGGMSSQSHICMVEIRGWDACEHSYDLFTITENRYLLLGKKKKKIYIYIYTYTHIYICGGWMDPSHSENHDRWVLFTSLCILKVPLNSWN